MDRLACKACDAVGSILRKGRSGKVNGKHQCQSGDEAELPGFPCHRLDYGVRIHERSAKLLAPSTGVISAGRRCQTKGTCSGRMTAILRFGVLVNDCLMCAAAPSHV